MFAYVVLRGPRPTGDTSALTKELRDWVGQQLGPIAKPDDIRFADNLPKTRSGKIMRRLLKAIARGEEITQDVSTLENPAIIDQLRGTQGVPAARPAKTGKVGAAPKVAKAAKAKRKAPTASGRTRAPPRRAAKKAAVRKKSASKARPGSRRPSPGAAAQAARRRRPKRR